MPIHIDSMSKRTVELTTYALSASFRDVCPSCTELLDIHQPDPRNPDRLLLVCRSCETWYLANLEARVMTLLPD